MTPRPFQSAAMAEVGKRLRAGSRAVLLVSPTGSGKTCMGAMMAERWVVMSGKRIAWGAHRAELIDQAYNTLRSFGLDVGLRGRNTGAPIQLGTYQEWVSRGEAPEADVFVADEAHHMGDRVGWQGIPKRYKEIGKTIIGLTATPARGDGRALPDFDQLVVAAQIAQLQSMGLLVPLRWRGPGAELSSKQIAQRPVDAYLSEARGRCAVVFAPNIRSAMQYVEDFGAAGVQARLVTGDMSTGDRGDVLDRHTRGDLPVIVNVAVLTEGWDNPRCDCVIVARGCSSAGLWIQMAGRGLRPHPGKAECLLLDLRGIAHRLGRPDAEAHYSLDGEGIVLSTERNPDGERMCKVCATPLGDAIVCPQCGKDHSPPVPKVVDEQLTDWDATKAVLKPNRLVLCLAGILRKGASEQQAHVRFRHIMKRPPSAYEMQSARNFLRATEKYGAVNDNA